MTSPLAAPPPRRPSGSPPKIAIVGIPGGWSSESLADAVAARTGFRCLIDMEHVVVDLARGTVRHGDVELTELDGIIVKKIAAAYSADALDRVEILTYLEHRGVRVFSRPSSIQPLIDRLSCTVRLRMGDIPMPETTITESLDAAIAAVERYGRAIGKPLYTSKARGMKVFEAGREAAAELRAFKAAGNPVMYLQKMIPNMGRDLGVAFLGGQYLATYARVQRGSSWTTSTASGGKYEQCEPSPATIAIATRAQAIFGVDFTTVDVVETEDGPLVFEVSAFGGFRGLRDACKVDAAEAYVDHVLSRLTAGEEVAP